MLDEFCKDCPPPGGEQTSWDTIISALRAARVPEVG